jgi:hypothetical protein
MHNVPMGRPLLVLDMYEHAYHMDYGAAVAKYVDAFLQNVHWEEVNHRAESVSKVWAAALNDLSQQGDLRNGQLLHSAIDNPHSLGDRMGSCHDRFGNPIQR